MDHLINYSLTDNIQVMSDFYHYKYVYNKHLYT